MIWHILALLIVSGCESHFRSLFSLFFLRNIYYSLWQNFEVFSFFQKSKNLFLKKSTDKSVFLILDAERRDQASGCEAGSGSGTGKSTATSNSCPTSGKNKASFYSSFLVLSRSYLALDLKGKHFNFLGTTTSGSRTNLDETGDGRTNLRPGTGCEKTHHSGQSGGQ